MFFFCVYTKHLVITFYNIIEEQHYFIAIVGIMEASKVEPSAPLWSGTYIFFMLNCGTSPLWSFWGFVWVCMFVLLHFFLIDCGSLLLHLFVFLMLQHFVFTALDVCRVFPLLSAIVTAEYKSKNGFNVEVTQYVRWAAHPKVSESIIHSFIHSFIHSTVQVSSKISLNWLPFCV